MPGAEAALLGGMAEIPAAEWDALACPEAAAGRPIDPFTTHRFLSALDASRSTGAAAGWQTRPLILREGGRAVAALPLYVKAHSQGEYIFDHGWAEAYARAGGRYYPKLQAAVPFTPVSGRRFLCPPSLRPALMDAAVSLTENNGLSGLHITFCTADEAESLEGHGGTLHRITQQYHWENPGYSSFEHFLSALSSRKRKMIRKEREVAAGHGLTIRSLTGDDILPEHLAAMWDFYQDTGGRKWGSPYLTRRFFDLAFETLRQDLLLVLAFDGARPVAGALNFIGRDTLYGRYWGCAADFPCLHFEMCYYRAMDYAIAHGLRVEAGAQGDHKLARGYLPAPVHSLHFIADPGLRAAIARYLDEERRATESDIEVLTAYGPFRKDQRAEPD